EAEFHSEFGSARPRLFGALLCALVGALEHVPHVKMARKPRMAAFALFGVAVERALGWPHDPFIKAYEANRSAANSSAIEASPVAGSESQILPAARKLGIEKCGFHAFRHGNETVMDGEGVPMATRLNRLGHSDPR